MIVKSYYEMLRRRDIDGVLALLAPDVEWTLPDGLAPYGLGGTRVGLDETRRVLDRFAEVVRSEPEEFAESGDGVFVLGTHHFHTPDGRSRSVRFTHVWRLADGKVTRFEDRFDTATVLDVLAAQDRLIQLGLGFWGAKVLLSALELGLYTELETAPADAETLTARLGLHQRGARDFFDSQVALGLLEREDGVYRNTPDAAMFLDRTKDTYIGGLLEMANEQWYRSWGNLTTALRTGEPQNNVGGDPFDVLYADPELTRRFQKAMTGGSMAAAQALARTFPWAGYSSVADVGCSEGILLSTVLRAHPHLSGIGFDLPPVGPSFAETVARSGLAGRMRFLPGSFVTDPLPEAEVVVFGRVLHDWDLPTKRMLLEKAHKALPDGGAVVVYESMIDDDRRTNTFGLLTSLHMLLESPGGFDYSGADCAGWMADAGFRDCAAEPLDGPVSVVIGHK